MSRTTVVPLGPQHPVLVEPIHLKLTTREEIVEGVEAHIGYNHRGMEKLLENDFKKNTPVTERVCGICSHQHSTVYCQAIERVMGIEVPERALYIRTVLFELNRIHSHMLILGLMADSIGYENLFMQIWRDREIAMGVIERITGNRVHYAMNTVGGVRRDINYDMVQDVLKGVDALDERFVELDRILRTDSTWLSRTRDVGKLSRQDAIRLGAVGPVARGSGVPYDIRTTVAHPYAAYQMLHFHPILEEAGDTWARNYVRMRELRQSADLIHQCIDSMRDGPILAEVKGNPNGEAFSRVEASRGELVYYVRGSGKPAMDRVKIRTPTFANIPSLIPMLTGADIAGVPPIVTSIDPCICCTDR